MLTRPSMLVACALGLAVNAAGCGMVGIELLNVESADGGGEDGGMPDAADLDADGMDASDEGGASDADSDVEASTPFDAGDSDAADADTDLDGEADASDAADANDAADTSDAADAADAYVDSGPPPCDFSGTWATKVDLAVSWSGNLGVNGGSGTAQVWTRHQSTANGGVVPGTMVGCGVSLPGFGFTVFAGGGTGRVSFEIPLFNMAPPASTTPAVLTVQGAGFPGDPIVLSPTAMVFGATLADPLNGSWPSASQIVSNDMDGDGKPGVTLPHLNGNGYVYLPIEAFASARSEAGYYASRVVLSATGTVVSCTETGGTAQVPRFDSRIMGCRRVGGAECSSSQANLLESFRPSHNPGTATYRAIKVANNASCAAVRSALP